VDEQGNWSVQSTTPLSSGRHTVNFYQKNGERQSTGNPTRDFFVSEKARGNL